MVCSASVLASLDATAETIFPTFKAAAIEMILAQRWHWSAGTPRYRIQCLWKGLNMAEWSVIYHRV